MSNTNYGDLNLSGNHFDTSFGSLTGKESYKNILAKIGEQPEGVIFLTKSPEEAKAVKEILTHRRNIQKLDESDKQMTRIRSFNELE
jgi:methionine salvage enolase-phosphatase E1